MPFVFEDQPVTSAPGLGPIQFDPSIDPEEKAEISKRLGATSSRFVFEDEQPSFFERLKSGAGVAAKSVKDFLTAETPETPKRIMESLVPDPTAPAKVLEAFPEERRRAQETLKPIFGRAGEPIGTAAAAARTLFGLPFSLLPKIVTQPVGEAMQATGELAKKGAKAVGAPEELATAVGEFTPDVLMILGPVAFKALKGRAGTSSEIAKAAREDPAFIDELTRRQREIADVFEEGLTRQEQLRESPVGRELLARQLRAEETRSKRLTPETPVEEIFKPVEETPPTAAQRRVSDLLAQAEEQLRSKAVVGNKTLQAAFDALLGKETSEALAEKAARRGMIAGEERVVPRETERSRPIELTDIVEPEITAQEGVPAFISKARRQELFDLGYSGKDIVKMSPAEAEAIIKEQRTAARPETAKPLEAPPAIPKTESPALQTAIRTAEERQTAETEAMRMKTQRGSVEVSGLKDYLNRDTSARDLTKQEIREQSGQLARRRAQAERNLRGRRKEWQGRNIRDSLNFIDSIEGGRSQVLPDDQPLADQLRKLLDQKRADVQALGTGKLEHFIENYFPHIWEQPNQVADFFSRYFGKRPLAGPKSFLKQRTIPTTAEGIAAGLKPVTYNPVDLALLKAAEMDRYIMAEKIKQALVDQGLAKWVTRHEDIPQGWQPLNDSHFQGALRSQAYYAPPDAAKVFNNYLSPGLRGNVLYDAARYAGNLLNQAQLGFSAFHLGFTSIDAITSDVALAIEQAARGRPVKAAKSALRAATLSSPIENALTGNRLLKEYLNPGSYAKFSREADALAKAGGRAFQDLHYTNQAIDSFWKSWKEGDWAKVGLKSFPATMELLSKPIMEYIVPRQKLGVFTKIATDLLERAERGGWSEQEIRAEMQRAWDSVDNRMGQIVYDNLFWNRVTKDLGLVSVRSLGWNLGTVRELGGGLKDIAAQAGKLAVGKKPELTHRMAYVLALPLTVGFLGAIYNYLSTGETPQETRDYFFPRTGGVDQNGRPERVSLPSYMKDIYAFSKHPLTTVGHKVQPVIAAISDMLSNEDFYGTEIRHPGDPLVRQGQDITKFVAAQFLPFSVRNAQQRAKAAGEEGPGGLVKGEELPKTIQSFLGITPSPASVNKTAAEELAVEFLARRTPEGPRTKEEAAQRDTAQALERRFRLGKAGKEELARAAEIGDITKRQAINILRESKKQPLVRMIGRLRLDEALKVWESATPKEQEQILPFVLRKVRGLPNYPPEQREKLKRKIKTIKELGLRHGGDMPLSEFFPVEYTPLEATE